ncbi:Response regulator receiver domain-containing protein [Dyadobacter koreensis]|uniref:Response regulator receiver domain-containing protein n=1 Tax=Dyadobacter koreensis TaxID=408657 RepID=A0A1H6YGV3_9BACT|nr:response regulator [Dyadobacter koreensis]SEJ40479.1 Response regulator receiver domain-containing protein [Dyadobacter koreensis]
MKKILVIDDDRDILELLKIVFRDSGHEVIFSETEMGTNDIYVLHPDLILLDVRIKGSSKSGAEICRELKADTKTRNFPVVLCSGEYNLHDIARECEADVYLAKPYNLTSLLTQVNRFIS